MANTLTLIQVRLPTKQVRKLDKAKKEAGVITRAAFLRQIIYNYLKELEEEG